MVEADGAATQNGEEQHASSQVDPVWAAFPRNKRPLGRLFVLAPVTMTRKYLVRHRCLNPGDVRLADVDLLEFDNLMGKHQGILRAACEKLERTATKRTNELLDANSLAELTVDSVAPDKRDALVKQALHRREAAGRMLGVDPGSADQAITDELIRTAGEHVPRTARFITKRGKVYVATADQFGDDVRELQAVFASCRRDYFYAVIGWFVGKGLTSMDLLVEEVQEFEEMNAVDPYGR